ncbi:MAG: DUF4097 domain-containing protein [Gemmatimonadaceae bacterium]
MRTIMNVPVLALLVLAATASNGSTQQRIDQRRALDPKGSVRIYNLSGTIRITAWTKDSVAITGTLPGHSRFYMGGSGSGVKAFVESDDESTPRDGGKYEIRVPARSRLWVKATVADIEISGVSGALDVNALSGRIHVIGSPQELFVESMDGQVDIGATTTSLRVKTASGDISVRGGSEDATLGTVSGRITVGAGRFERGRFESVTGNISWSAEFQRGGSFTFDSHSGTIALALDPRAPADFEITSFNGTIRNDFSKKRAIPGRGGPGQQLAFAVGDGGTAITIRNFKGPIELRRK